jgi:hypothetical protein
MECSPGFTRPFEGGFEMIFGVKLHDTRKEHEGGVVCLMELAFGG